MLQLKMSHLYSPAFSNPDVFTLEQMKSCLGFCAFVSLCDGMKPAGGV